MKTKRFVLGVVGMCVGLAVSTAQGQNGDEIAFRFIDGASRVVHSYTSLGLSSFTPPSEVVDVNTNMAVVDYLIVAGGGGGGGVNSGTNAGSGGGGAGGVIFKESVSVGVGPHETRVGNGGASNSNGQNSWAFGDIAIGGGAGGSRSSSDRPQVGGSGGGGGPYNSGGNNWQIGAAGTPGQGKDGGNWSNRLGGGGGGAGGDGDQGGTESDASGGLGGRGGNGIQIGITGIDLYYGGGGGGGTGNDRGLVGGAGGLGGGGTGGVDFVGFRAGEDGARNTGGGGGGAGAIRDSDPGGRGGSGIVVVRYAWDTNNTYSMSGSLRRLLIEDELNVAVSSTSTLTILDDGHVNIGKADGSAAGRLVVDGTLSLGNDASLTVKAAGAIGGSGTVDGDLKIEEGGGLLFTGMTLAVTGEVDLHSSFGVHSLVGLDGNTAVDDYILISGTQTDFSKLNIRNWGFDERVSIGGGKFAYFEQGSLKLVVIPEPHTLGLLLAAGALLALRRRRM